MTTSRPPSRRAANRQAARDRIAQQRAAQAAALRRRQQRRLAVIVGAVILVAVIVVIAVQTRRGAVDEAAAVPANATEAAAFEVGSAAAPVVIDVYEDFLCPVCRDFEDTAGDTLGSLVDDGSIRLRYRPIAILDGLSTDDYSTRAANAAAVVADAAGVDAFVEFHDLLYANQPAEGGAGLTDEQLIDFAAQAGATGADVEQGIQDETFADWVTLVTDRSSQDGVAGTPTVLVDGEVLQDRSPQGILDAVAAR